MVTIKNNTKTWKFYEIIVEGLNKHLEEVFNGNREQTLLGDAQPVRNRFIQ